MLPTILIFGLIFGLDKGGHLIYLIADAYGVRIIDYIYKKEPAKADGSVKSQKSRRSRGGGGIELLDLTGFPLLQSF